tara:strand:+ start:829 stop:1119 length:291 start_codon:yes stop_codon:yes gene_type:complete
MAIVTLPNGSEYNTGKPWNQQLDTGSSEFITEVMFANIPTATSMSGQNLNVPRITSRTWTETSYTGSNYIFNTNFSYEGNTYKSSNVRSTFTIEDK